MALNQKRMTVDYIFLPVASGILSGDPVVVGFITGVAQTDRDSNGYATIAIKPSSVWSITCQAVTTSGSPGAGSAIAVGDKLYIGTTEDVSKDSSGKLFGYALSTLTSGTTGAVDVLLA